MERSRILYFLLALFLLGSAGVLYETNALSVEWVDVAIPNLPVAFDGFRIALVTDLHGLEVPPDGQLVTAVQNANVDMVAATGDFIDSDTNELSQVLPMLGALAKLAPTYVVSGNHDYWADWDVVAGAIRRLGITVLENGHVRLRRGDDTLVIAGVSDAYTGRDRLDLALPPDDGTVVILLSHSPTLFDPEWSGFYLDESIEWPKKAQLLQRASLTLSGHTHGGQIKLPFLGAVSVAGGKVFPKERVEGLSQEPGGWLYISRGLGRTGLIKIRFLSRPEVSILTLRCVKP